MNTIYEILIVNLPTSLAVLFAIAYVKEVKKNSLFFVGLSLIMLAGWLAIPYTYWLLANYADVIKESLSFVNLTSLPIGFIQMLGLLLCTVAYRNNVKGK